jgi:hypothetical protein
MLFRKKYHSMNHNVARQMMNCGLLCMLDLLHTYTSLLIQHTESVQSSPATNVRQAWGEGSKTIRPTTSPSSLTSTPSSSSKTATLSSSKFSTANLVGSVFEDAELQLVCSILETVSLFAACSCGLIRNYLHETAEKKIRNYDHNENTTSDVTSRIGPMTRRFVCLLCGRRLQVPIFHTTSYPPANLGNLCLKCSSRKQDAKARTAEKASEEARKLEERYRESLERELRSLNRSTRLSLMQAGVIEAVGKWLVVDHWIIQVKGDCDKFDTLLV